MAKYGKSVCLMAPTERESERPREKGKKGGKDEAEFLGIGILVRFDGLNGRLTPVLPVGYGVHTYCVVRTTE